MVSLRKIRRSETGNILIWIFDNSGGRALTLMVGLATLAYFAWMINKSRKDKGEYMEISVFPLSFWRL